MADNVHYKGFRFLRSKDGGSVPLIERRAIASAHKAKTVVSSDKFKILKAGDPVKLVDDGTVTLAEGSEHDTDGTALYGVIAGFAPQWSAQQGKMIHTGIYPAEGVTYGSNLSRQTYVYVIPAGSAYFEIDADENSTATTYADYLDMVGENAIHVLGNIVDGEECDTMLDISSNATTAGLLWRITGVNQFHPENADFAGKYVKIEVTGNRLQDPSFTAAGVIGT